MDHPNPLYLDSPALRYRLSTRIIATSVAVFAIVLGMIGWTLWLSWQQEGAGAAINDTGSLRMRANQVAIALLHPGTGDGADPARLDDLLSTQTWILDHIRQGDAARPLALPHDPRIQEQMDRVMSLWEERLVPAARAVRAGESENVYLDLLPFFVVLG